MTKRQAGASHTFYCNWTEYSYKIHRWSNCTNPPVKKGVCYGRLTRLQLADKLVALQKSEER